MNKSPEPIILAVAIGLLALVAGGLAYIFPKVEDITNVSSTVPTGKTPQKLNEEELKSSLAPWDSPTQWQEPANGQRLFLSKGILFYPSRYPDGDYLQKDDGKATSPGGVLLSWYKKYQIDFTHPGVDRDDPDNDGFSNITEYKNGAANAKDVDGSKSTNPIDPESHPSYFSRLRLQKYEPHPFRIEFHGVEQLGGKTVFQIFLKDMPSYQQPKLKATGDQLGFENYVVGPYTPKTEQKMNDKTHTMEEVVEDTLELDQPEIGRKVILPYRKVIDSPESTADIVMLMPSEVDKVIKVALRQTFTPPYMPSKKYLLVNVNDNGALIRDVDTKEEFTLPKLDPVEWDEVPIPAATTAPAKTP